MKLIVPIAGSSSRFPGMRPKWMLTMPNGDLMLERAISGLKLDNISELVIIALEEHIEKFKISKDFIIEAIKLKIAPKKIKINLEILKKKTNSQPTTIFKYLINQKEDFSFYIKDCDNYFEFEPKPGNIVSYIPLSDLYLVAAITKSYIRFNRFQEIEQIAEKSVISSNFCCGGYGFSSAKDFIKTYNELNGKDDDSLYISHIIHKQLLEGSIFKADRAKKFEDYGTQKEYFSFIKEVSTILSDFDGVLVENSSKFALKPWSYIPNEANLKHLASFLEASPNSVLVITTSRPDSEKDNIERFLKSFNIKCHSIVTNLPHAKRMLINDFSTTNPFPSAQSINVPRNSQVLHEYLKTNN